MKRATAKTRAKTEAKAKAAPGPSPSAERPAPAPRPSDALSGDDRIAYYDAIAGVRPLGGPSRGRARSPEEKVAPGRVSTTPPTRSDDLVRDRLGALVAGGVRFDVRWEDERVLGRRVGVPASVEAELGRRGIAPEATLDLHGETGDDAERAVVRFVRRQHRRGARRLCLIHGKGTHSEGGLGVLQGRVVHALTEGGAAPVVEAFASACPELGGSGALVVQLVR